MKPAKYLSFFFLYMAAFTQLQGQSANELIHSVYNKLQKGKDYSVQAHIKVDMPLIRILPVDVQIYYKQPDKFRVVSKSIAVVPRQGFDQLSRMLADTGAFATILQGDGKIGTTVTRIVTIIPLSDTTDLILGKFWIDPVQSVILKSQLTTRSSGTIVTEYFYGSQLACGLPDKMVFSVDAGKFRIPKNVGEEADKSTTDSSDKTDGNKKGRIYITLTNYQVNKGIPDSIFDQK
jgi:hypothetical protein